MLRIYLDNNATTPVLPEVFEAMRPYFGEHFGNASSIHHHGQETRAAVEWARDLVAQLLGCRAPEIVFTSGGTEGDNLAIAGLTSAGDHIITSSIEHHAVLHACKRLEETGCDVTYVPVDGRGLLDPDDVRRALRPNTKLISSKVPIDVKRIGCDALSISGHKMHAPQGVGALYVRKGIRVQPLFYGGRHERSRRAGTENVPGIVALGRAAELAMQAFERGDDKKISALRDRLERGILAQVEEAGVNGDAALRVPNTSSIYFEHIEGESMVIALDLKGLAVSTGAACSSGAIEPSHVLTAMGLRAGRTRASLRFSLGKQNTTEDIDMALALVPETVARLRELSPVYRTQAVSS